MGEIGKTYSYKGHLYRIEKLIKMKIPGSFWNRVMSLLSQSTAWSLSEEFKDEESGKTGWVPCVVYTTMAGSNTYARESQDFFDKFKQVEEPDGNTGQ